MSRILSITLAMVAVFAVASANAQNFATNNSGLFDIQLLRSSSAQPGNDTNNWLSVWNAIDANPGFTTGVLNTTTPNVISPTISHNVSDTEFFFNYQGNAGNGRFFPGSGAFTINNNGPGGTGGPIGGPGPGVNEGDGGTNLADNYSIRGQTFIEFTAGGTYTIAMSSDDGRYISLTEALPGSAPGYAGFSAQNGQGAFFPPFVAGNTAIGFSGGTGVNDTLGTFSVAAGDILALDAFYYEGGGGDAGGISLAQGAQASFSTANFQLLQDNLFGGTIQLSTLVLQIPEPASIAIWSVLGLSLAGFGWYRARRHRVVAGSGTVVAVAVAACLLFASRPASAQPPPFLFPSSPNGLFDVQLLRISAANPGNRDGWLSVWNAIDANPSFATGVLNTTTPQVLSPTISHNVSDTETIFNYGGGAGNFPGFVFVGTINSDGPGGSGGPIGFYVPDPQQDGATNSNFADNYSIRGETYLRFNTAGTYTIASGSDDGRRIELTTAFAGSAPGFTGFTAQNGQVDGPAFVVGQTSIGNNGCCGQTLGTFSVAAGDILALDAFHFEGGGGDYGEISIALGAQAGFSTATFQLLQNGSLAGAVSVANALVATPEPASLVIWGVIGLGLAGFGVYRRRRK